MANDPPNTPQPEVEMPPKIFADMQGEFLGYTPGEALRMRFPVLERYQNAIGYMQGGVIVAAMDNAIGMLSYLVAPPSVTTHLTVSFIRPVTPDMAYIEVEATLTEKTNRFLFLGAVAKTPAGKVAALVNATGQVIQRD